MSNEKTSIAETIRESIATEPTNNRSWDYQ